jgi:nucleoid DNA-binding protein
MGLALGGSGEASADGLQTRDLRHGGAGARLAMHPRHARPVFLGQALEEAAAQRLGQEVQMPHQMVLTVAFEQFDQFVLVHQRTLKNRRNPRTSAKIETRWNRQMIFELTSVRLR